MNKSIDELIKEINSLPLFYLSLASKELFHSNFLFWLYKLNPKAWHSVFEINDKIITTKLIREDGKRITGENYTVVADLTGCNEEERVLIIENKVKDIPHEKQLHDLIRAFGEKPKYLLLTFVEPDFTPNFKWKVLLYKKMILNLEKYKSRFSTELYHQLLIEDYINLVKNTNLIYKQFPLTGNYDFSKHSLSKKGKDGLYNKFKEIKLWQAYQKIAGSRFVNEIGKSLKEKYPNIEVNSGITRQVICLDFFLKIGKFKIGIQIENNQFRHCLYGENVREKGEKLIESKIWFNKDFKAKGSNKGASFNSYKTKNSLLEFIYQYEDEFYKSSFLNKTDMILKLRLCFDEIQVNFEKIEKILQ